MLGGQVLAPALLLGHVLFEVAGGEGQGLPTEAHQVGVLEPRVTEAVLDGRPGPEEEVTSPELRGLSHFGFTTFSLYANIMYNMKRTINVYYGLLILAWGINTTILLRWSHQG